MKKVNISVSIDDEKLDALVFFMSRDNTSPQKELEEALNALYTKYVSSDTREYIESRIPAATPARPKRPSKPAASKAPSPAAMFSDDGSAKEVY